MCIFIYLKLTGGNDLAYTFTSFETEITISAVCGFIKVLNHMYKTLSGHLQELKNKLRKNP